MTEQIKIDFEKTIKTSSFSEKDAELKKIFLNKFIAKGFPSRKFENWKFSDMSQIIKKNIWELSFYNNYSLSNKINAEFWLAKNSNHVDAMLKYPSEYSEKMEKFYNSILK